MKHSFKDLRENPVNGNIIADLYFAGILICGIEFKFHDERAYLEDGFFLENGFYNDIFDNEQELLYELTCNRRELEKSFNDLGF